MANKQLKVDVIVNAKTKELDKMFKRLNKMQTKINQQASAQDRVTQAVNRTNKAHQKSKTLLDSLITKVHRLANAYLGVMGAKAAITSSDTITKAENKLNHLNNGDTAATQNQLDKMYTSAQKTRMGYADMMNNVSKSMTLAGKAFGGNIDNAIRFQEIMAEAYTLSGSSAAEMSSSMYQMIQGLSSGVLQGDELRSVREGASLAYQAIEEFARGIYGADKNLKDLASEGLITSDIVVKAILSNGEKMDSAFANTKMTFEQAWTSMKNVALKSFEPVLQKLNELLNSPIGKAIVSGVGKAIQIVANVLLWLFGIIEKLYSYIVDNWHIVKNVLLALATIIGTVLLVKVGQLIITFATLFQLIIVKAVVAASAWLAAWWPIVLLIGILVAGVIYWANTTQSACDFIYNVCLGLGYAIVAILAMVLVAYIITGTIMLSIPMLIALVVIGVLSLLIAAFVKFTGEIVGGALGILEVIKAVITWIDNGWNNMCNNMKAWWWNAIADMLEGVDWLLKGISAIRKVLGMDAISIESIRAKADAYKSKVVENDLDIHGAWDAGYSRGYAIGEGIQDKINDVGDKIKGALNGGDINALLGVDDLPSVGINPNLDEIAGNTGDTKDNTGKIAKSMELTAEDLEYLRRVANMEWKKEFTTANITVDMTNNNNVSNDFDLKSLATSLRDLVEEEMFVAANGTYV